MLSGGMLSGAVYTEFSKSFELLLKNQNPQQTTKRKIHLFARYMKQVLMHIWKYWGTVQNPNTNTIHPGLAMWSQHLFAHKVNLHHPPLTVRGFLPQVCAQHFMSNIWREMGSPEGRIILASWDPVRAQLWAGILLCAWLCSSYALTKLTLIPQKNKQLHQ